MTDAPLFPAPASVTPEPEMLSPTVGPGGPILLEDHYLIEELARLGRQSAPERVLLPRGGGALGAFTVTGDVSELTSAAVFQPGTTTEALTRFSSSDTGPGAGMRDLRGFAVRLYSSEGNLDIVGASAPVYYVREPGLVPELIRALRTGSHDGVHPNERRWDFLTRTPSSAHLLAHLMGDRGIPRSWREQNGYGVHTFQWIGPDGTRSWVKYHWHSEQRGAFVAEHGHEGLTTAEALRLAESDPDHHRSDLASAIDSGQSPTWTLSVQVMPYDEALERRENPFDATKIWPHDEYPLRTVGELVLDRSPAGIDGHVENAAFAPTNLVPGIGLSPDGMLLSRSSVYARTQVERLGEDYPHLPVNRPVGTQSAPVLDVEPELLRVAGVVDGDDFSQAGRLVRSVLDDAGRYRMVGNIAAQLLDGVGDDVLHRVIGYWHAVDAPLAARVHNVVHSARQEIARPRPL